MNFFAITFRKFRSKTFRQGKDMASQVTKLMKHQSDILPDENLLALNNGLTDFKAILHDPDKEGDLKQAMNDLENVANKNFKHYANPIARENFEVFLVAIAVALSVRSFFVQPFKIPTGSMQPTLYGNTAYNLRLDPESEVPGFFPKTFDFFMKGTSYYSLTAKNDGVLERIGPVKTVIPKLLSKREFIIGGVKHTMWNPPPTIVNSGSVTDYLIRHGGPTPNRPLTTGEYFKKGDPLVKIKFVRGDFLFVDRLSYNFRSPKRGEIIVFKTEGIEGMQRQNPSFQNQFYIKRLVALGGEKVRIGNDRHLYINGQKIDKTHKGFENVYGFDPSKPARDSRWSGHVNDWTHKSFQPTPFVLYPFFRDGASEYLVKEDHVMAMGDNTMNSSDSRSWGSLPEKNVVGRFYFAFWPFLRDRPED